jgi:hypothetical protein
LTRVQAMLSKIGLPALLVLCLLSAAGLPGCGGDEGTTETQTPSAEAKPGAPTGAADETPDPKPQADDAASSKKKPVNKNPSVSKSPAPAKKQIAAPEKDKKLAEGGRPPGLSDEEYCELEPEACGPEETPPDRSNPDVRRAEERAEEPDEPEKCDSADCERARRAER